MFKVSAAEDKSSSSVGCSWLFSLLTFRRKMISHQKTFINTRDIQLCSESSGHVNIPDTVWTGLFGSVSGSSLKTSVNADSVSRSEFLWRLPDAGFGLSLETVKTQRTRRTTDLKSGFNVLQTCGSVLNLEGVSSWDQCRLHADIYSRPGSAVNAAAGRRLSLFIHLITAQFVWGSEFFAAVWHLAVNESWDESSRRNEPSCRSPHNAIRQRKGHKHFPPASLWNSPNLRSAGADLLPAGQENNED